MCGIVGGWFAEHENVDLSLSLNAMAHRGPDGQGQYTDISTGVMLGHVRLAIIDTSQAGHQPMLSDDQQVVISFNGEIYNFRELRGELESRGVTFRGHSDTEVLLKLYIAEGISMLSRLNGVFAFAIYDKRNGDLFVVRDALGVKPLYYTAEKSFSFASEIKGLLSLSDHRKEIDQSAINRYMTYLWCPGEGTPLKNVRKLEPGEALHIKNKKVVRQWTWYELPQKRLLPVAMNAHKAISNVHDGLRTAVQRQLVSDVPVGAFLSGGLDSSAVVAFAREQIPDLRCFTIEASGGVDEGEADDLPYAQRVAKHLGVKLDVVKIDSSRMANDLEKMVWQLDEPLADPSPLNVLYISQLARESGIKVLLSGAGGDDLFTGYRRHLALGYERLWNWLPQSVLGNLGELTSHLDQRSTLGRRLSKLFAGAGESGDVRLASYFAWARRSDLFNLYSDQLRAAVIHERTEQPMLDFLENILPGCSQLDRMLALEQRFFLADHNLVYTDKMSMAAGVEVRVPFLDLDLVDLAAQIPDKYKQRGNVGKWVLKKAMEPYLPHDVIYRPKTGFGAPLRRWMRHDLREMLGDLLSEQSLRQRGLFNPQAVQRLMVDNDAGRVDAAYTLLSLLCIEIWCRRYIDK